MSQSNDVTKYKVLIGEIDGNELAFERELALSTDNVEVNSTRFESNQLTKALEEAKDTINMAPIVLQSNLTIESNSALIMIDPEIGDYILEVEGHLGIF